jgi:outer membrane scaffolding protein for murein synthesis (MipA/OmpV family)
MKPLLMISFLIALAATPARAQSAASGRFSVGAAAGIATPLHGDFDFTAQAWQVDVRLDTARHFASTVFFEQWLRKDEEIRTGVMLTGPTGPIGRVDRIVSETSHRASVLGWSLLAKSTGRIVVSGGGGVSYLVYSRRFTQTLEGCTPASLCDTSRSDHDSSAFAAQLQAGIDAELVPHLAVMGQFRLIVPIEDPGFGHHTVLGGVRFRF